MARIYEAQSFIPMRVITQYGTFEIAQPPAEVGLPEQETGDVRGKNALRRANWFNGRFLTAEALGMQDAYWDHRLRLQARVHPAGIAYGLGVTLVTAAAGKQQYLPMFREVGGGFALDDKIVQLHPGLAFDGIGRPILVGSPHTFALADLVTSYKARPRRLVAGGTRFTPCVCVEEDPGAPVEPGPAIGEGAYLLVIEPGECPEGEAVVYGDLCASEGENKHCEANGWRGAYGLSLVRVDVDLSGSQISSAWDLRGLLSSYYFDVYEHSLIERWDPDFALDDAFCAGSGPHTHIAGVVPLAMVYVGAEAGQVHWLDPWIPRRTQVATSASDWSWSLIGTPPPAAAVARVHQFQCMLSESILQTPVAGIARQRIHGPNLFERGFRNIPPVGILPIQPEAITGHAEFGEQMQLALRKKGEAAFVDLACELGRLHFAGTNVGTYCVVAPHDDDTLEDWQNAFNKDPISLATAKSSQGELGKYRNREPNAWTTYQQGTTAGKLPGFNMLEASSGTTLMAALLAYLSGTELANRSVELVKLIVPMQGTDRRHPVVGKTPLDWQSLAERWLGSSPLSNLGFAAAATGGAPPPNIAGVPGAAPPLAAENLTVVATRTPSEHALPRHFVIYVKQRVVILDVLYDFMRKIQYYLAIAKQPQQEPTETMRGQIRAQGLVQTAQYQAVMQDETVRRTIAEAAGASNPVLRQKWHEQYFNEVTRLEEEYVAAGTPAPEARQLAIDRSLDAMAAEHEEFEIMRPLVAAQPTVEDSERIMRELAVVAKANPAVDPTGRELEINLGHQVIHGGGIRVWTNRNSRALWTRVRSGLGERKVSELVAGSEEEVTVETVLKLEKSVAVRRFGEATVNAVTEKMTENAERAAKAVELVTAKQPPRALAEAYQRKFAQTRNATEALNEVSREFGRDPEARTFLKGMQALASSVSAKSFEGVAGEVFGTR